MKRNGVVVAGVVALAVTAAMCLGYGLIELQVWGLRVEGIGRILSALGITAFPAMGLLIATREPRNRVGWVLLALGPMLMLLVGNLDYAGYALQVHPGSLPGGEVAASIDVWFWAPTLALLVLVLPLIFPTGNLVSRRWWPLLGTTTVFVVLSSLSTAFLPGPIDSRFPTIQNPLGVQAYAEILNVVGFVGFLVGALTLAGTIVSMVVRYRRAAPDERQQMKWVLFSFAAVIPSLAANSFNLIALSEILSAIFVPLIAVAIGVAILRYRLYDIDLVISRTLVYGALAVFITAVYVAIVVGVGSLVGRGGQPNLLLSIVATAVVAVAFQPVRERLQKIANRLIYGERATPYEVLSEFSSRVAETYAGDQVLSRMARVLADGTAAERAEVWVTAGSELRAEAVWPAAPAGNGQATLPATGQLTPLIPGADRSVPVRHQGEMLGVLAVRKRPGESLTPIEEKLLDDLAHQAGLVLKNVGLTADLQLRLEELRASRQRLVAAQDQERRRLERNLHDGAQQHLVALKVKLALAEALTHKDPEKTIATIQQLKADADEALETLRELARGIYPPLLAEKGLPDALASRARKASIEVVISADGIGRYSQEVEAAVYFCTLEALQNIEKYAGAERATLRLEETTGVLAFEVADRGRGYDPASTRPGSGLQNMADRLDALGGKLEVIAAIGEGVTVRGRLPVERVAVSA